MRNVRIYAEYIHSKNQGDYDGLNKGCRWGTRNAKFQWGKFYETGHFEHLEANERIIL
jgi:hypothetical protein